MSVMLVSNMTKSGKSAICVGLISVLIERGKKVGYMKPIGNALVEVEKKLVDEDALVMKGLFSFSEPLETISPIPYTEKLIQSSIKGEITDLQSTITKAFAEISSGKDFVVVEGAGSLGTGSVISLSNSQVAKLLDLPVVLVASDKDFVEDDILTSLSLLRYEGIRVCGVVVNDVPSYRVKWMERFLDSLEVPMVSIIPSEPRLRTVTVNEIVELTGADVLSAHHNLDGEVGTLVVGALDPESSVRSFRRRKDVVIVTGSGRSDIISTAIGCCVKCVVVSGEHPPDRAVVSYAEECGVPVLHTR